MEYELEKLEERVGKGYRASSKLDGDRFEQYDCKEGLTLRLSYSSHDWKGVLFKKFKANEKDYGLFKDITDKLKIINHKPHYMHYLKSGVKQDNLEIAIKDNVLPDFTRNHVLKEAGRKSFIGTMTAGISMVLFSGGNQNIMVGAGLGVGVVGMCVALAATGYGFGKYELRPKTQLNRFIKCHTRVEELSSKLTSTRKFKKAKEDLDMSYRLLRDMFNVTPHANGVLSITYNSPSRNIVLDYFADLLGSEKPTVEEEKVIITDPWKIQVKKVDGNSGK